MNLAWHILNIACAVIGVWAAFTMGAQWWFGEPAGAAVRIWAIFGCVLYVADRVEDAFGKPNRK